MLTLPGLSSLPVNACHCSLLRWLSIRLETLGGLSAFAAATLAVEQGGAASVVGLSLSYALQITQLTNMTVLPFCAVPLRLLSVKCTAPKAQLLQQSPEQSLQRCVRLVHPRKNFQTLSHAPSNRS